MFVYVQQSDLKEGNVHKLPLIIKIRGEISEFTPIYVIQSLVVSVADPGRRIGRRSRGALAQVA